jgi:signal transduction histidine kinase
MSLDEKQKDLSAEFQLQALELKIKKLEQENAQLRQQVEQISKDRIEYLQNVSHQLVAPLNAMKWHIENLTAGRIATSDRIQKVLRSVYSQATISVHLAKNFALMSNLEADHSINNLREPLEPVNLCKLMINLADDFQPLAWDKDIQIEVIKNPLELAPDVLLLKELISQVFSNILENAVKYSSHGTVITIDGDRDIKNNMVTIRIKNRGIPLGPEDQKHLFTRGYRSQEAKNQYPAGTGFGLYIAKRIVEIHEGTISASTDSSNKTVFSVSLSIDKLLGMARQRGTKNNINNR